MALETNPTGRGPWHKLDKHYGGWRRGNVVARPTADTSEIKILPEVDPRKEMPGVFNQWALGSCTIHAIIGQLMYDSSLDGVKLEMLSRLWGYWQERKKEGSLGQGDTGAIGSDGLWVAQHVGLPKETAWPYNWPGIRQDQSPENSVFDPATPPKAATEGENYFKLKKKTAVVPQTEEDCKRVLSNNQTIAYGFTVFESFESDEVAKTGIVPMPGKDESQLGGHETLVVGYLKSEPDYALVRNSWDVTWGLKGYFLFPWKYLLDKNLTGDLRTVVRPLKK